MSQSYSAGFIAWRIVKSEPSMFEGLLAIAAEEIGLLREQSRASLNTLQYQTALQKESAAVGIEQFLAAVQAEANDYSPPKTSA